MQCSGHEKQFLECNHETLSNSNCQTTVTVYCQRCKLYSFNSTVMLLKGHDVNSFSNKIILMLQPLLMDLLIVLMVMLGFMEVLYQMKEYYMYVSTEHGVLSVGTITGLIMMPL